MEPPLLINLAIIPTVKRKRDKHEALKRQSEWIASRRGRTLTCLISGVSGHNARGCQKFEKMNGEDTSMSGQLKNKKQMKEKQLMKRQRTLIDNEDVEPSLSRFTNDATIEDFPLIAPQPSQTVHQVNISPLLASPLGSPSLVHLQVILISDFQYLSFEVEEDIP
ncbi:Dolichol phosphate-mannose biosynthesis regulatory protein [Datura stramonium]|uniref:Dolichol phosphate-mannose biosynthesis regulatory protein n=1 Tax=Datura stramonium TaxID=4076 RepID=A0ABS8SGR4_DATST|nr:Dolichol phosphate-mannose biosynthesis regulatory protein [Datura stramonium]